MFEVSILHDHRGIPATLQFTGARFTCDSVSGAVHIHLDTETGMDWHRTREAIEQEAAAEDGDFDPATEGDWAREATKEPDGSEA